VIKSYEKTSNRPRRVAELIKRELAMLIMKECHDPGIGDVTVISVEVSKDFSHARVYFSCLEGITQSKQSLQSLNKAAGFLRYQLKHRLVLRNVPELRFIYDDTIEKGMAISTLIDRALHKEIKR
jgi:ribosome-binding factor A